MKEHISYSKDTISKYIRVEIWKLRILIIQQPFKMKLGIPESEIWLEIHKRRKHPSRITKQGTWLIQPMSVKTIG